MKPVMIGPIRGRDHGNSAKRLRAYRADRYCLGIMIGGLTAMAPGRRREIVTLGPKTLISGALATCLTGAVIGMLV